LHTLQTFSACPTLAYSFKAHIPKDIIGQMQVVSVYEVKLGPLHLIRLTQLNKVAISNLKDTRRIDDAKKSKKEINS
jgi:hypothetical protein